VQFVFPHQLPLLGDAAWNNTRLLTAGAFGVLMVVELIRHWQDIHLCENLGAVMKAMQSDRGLLEPTP
jgi:hypothetical protein